MYGIVSFGDDIPTIPRAVAASSSQSSNVVFFMNAV
jgi:hypothetical protein